MNAQLLYSTFLVLTLAIPHAAFAEEPVWDGNTVVLTSEKLADGVYAYYPPKPFP